MQVVSRDDLRAQRFPQLGYSAQDKSQLNLATFAQAHAALQAGAHVLVDGMTFSRAAEREALSQIARRCDAVFQPVLLDCPLALAESRVRVSSSHPAADRSVQRVREVAARFEPCGPEVWRLNAQRPVAALAQEFLQRFRVCAAQ